MHKQELIEKLRHFAEMDKITARTGESVRWRGQAEFALFFAEYLTKLKIPADEKYDFWRIEPHLSQLAVDAFEQLRTSTDVDAQVSRGIYAEATGHDVPNITDIGASNMLHQCSAVQTTLGFMLKEVTGQDWLEEEIDAYCNAQRHLLQQTFDKFLRKVFRTGLCDLINESTSSGMSGKFGEVDLRTFTTAGRLMFTFAKCIDTSKPNHYKEGNDWYCNEWTISFVGEDGDPLCLSAGIQSVGCDLRTALDLIEDVIKDWPLEAKQQKKVFKTDKKVSIT